jgi:tellurite resistance protein
MTRPHSHSNTTSFDPTAYSRAHHDEEILRALVTAGAFVALADGRVDPVERDALLNFIDRQGLVPGISQDEIGRFFDGRVQQIKNQRDEIDIAEPLRPLTGRSSASAVVGAAERVAAADLQIHPCEVEALNLIRRIMMTPSDRHSNTSCFCPRVFFVHRGSCRDLYRGSNDHCSGRERADSPDCDAEISDRLAQ